MSGRELVSASTDSTLRLWDVKENTLLRTMRGHTNDKNFVGLSVSNEFLACGSETNEVFVYQKQVRPEALMEASSVLSRRSFSYAGGPKSEAESRQRRLDMSRKFQRMMLSPVFCGVLFCR